MRSTPFLGPLLGLVLIGCASVPPAQEAYANPSVQNDVVPFIDTVEALGAATIVARVHLISRTPLGTLMLRNPETGQRYRANSEDLPSCGYVYKARVVESFKGEGNSFEFFSADVADFSGFDHDYFVIVYNRKASDDQPRDIFPLLTLTWQEQERLDRLECLTSQPLYVGHSYQTMFSFDPVAAKQLGGEWLSSANRAALAWWSYDTAVAKEGERRAVYDSLVVGSVTDYGGRSWRRLGRANPPYSEGEIARYPVGNWAEFRTTIIRQLTYAADRRRRGR